MKWKMITGNHFISEVDDYTVTVIPNTSLYPYWSIIKDGIIIDEATKHSPFTTDFNKELACKAQAERYLQTHLIKS